MFGILKSAVILGMMASFASCGILNGTKKRAEQPLHDVQKLVDSKSGKEVVIVRMRHLGSQASYDQVRDYLDKLKSEGYVTFCEGVVPVPFHIDTVGEVTMPQLNELSKNLSAEDSLRLDTLFRKCRRMLGFMIGREGYTDPENKSVETTAKEQEYVSQDDDRMNLTTDRDLWADYSLYDLIEVYERRYGPITLSDYDFQTGLLEKYMPPTPVSVRQRDVFQCFLRNDNIVRRIAESNHPKIAVVYGAAHSFGIVYYLKKDHGFRREGSYKAQ